jgi:uncharacterized membrane protein
MSATTVILLILIFALGLALGAGLILFLLRRERQATAKAAKAERVSAPPRSAPVLRFRFSFIALPLVIAMTSIISAFVVFPFLPAQVAYRFTMGGAPASYMARGTFFVLMTVAQLAIVGSAYIIASSIVNLGRRAAQDQPLPVDPSRVIWLMANMVVLPQVILAFILVDAAIYGSTTRHLLTPWIFSLLTLGLGSVAIVALFLKSFRDYRK